MLIFVDKSIKFLYNYHSLIKTMIKTDVISWSLREKNPLAERFFTTKWRYSLWSCVPNERFSRLRRKVPVSDN